MTKSGQILKRFWRATYSFVTTENHLKIKIKPERKKIELPSQNELENWLIPEDPLSWEFLQQLHDPEEVKKLIKERHGLDFRDLFEQIPNANNPIVKFDEYYLLKLAIFRLECMDWKRVSNFFDEEFKDFGKTDIVDVLKNSCARCFTDKLKSKIKLNFNDIGFTVKRIAESDNCVSLVESICKRTQLPVDLVFSRSFIKTKLDSKFSFKDVCYYFLQSITDNRKLDLPAHDAALVRIKISQFFSKEARSFLPNNVSKARIEARMKATIKEGDRK